MPKSVKTVLISLAGSVLYILAYNEPEFFWPLALVALVPLFFLVERAGSPRQAFWRGLLFGATVIGGILLWFWDAYPLRWAGIDSRFAAFSVIFSVWASSSLVLGAFFGLWGFVFKKLAVRGWPDMLIAPATWILSEFARSFVYALFSAGSSAAYGPYWTFGFLGYPLVWSKTFVALAPLGGVYLLSFAGAAVNYAIFRILISREKRGDYFLALAAVFTAAAIAGATGDKIFGGNSPGRSASVAAVSTNFPSLFFERPSDAALKAGIIEKNLLLAAELNPDIVVLPEDSRALRYLGTSTVDGIFGNGGNVLLIDSSVARAGEKTKEQMFFYRPASGLSEVQEKHFLVPYGEYLPYQAMAAAPFVGQSEWVKKFNASRGYEEGDVAGTHGFGKDYVGALFCSEIVPENFYRKLSGDGAGLLLNVSSQSVFRGNDILYSQTLSLAKMKAAANRRYFVLAGNFIPSFILNERGDVVSESRKGGGEIIFGEIRFNYGKTVYTLFGDWILLAAAAITGAALSRPAAL